MISLIPRRSVEIFTNFVERVVAEFPGLKNWFASDSFVVKFTSTANISSTEYLKTDLLRIHHACMAI